MAKAIRRVSAGGSHGVLRQQAHRARLTTNLEPAVVAVMLEGSLETRDRRDPIAKSPGLRKFVDRAIQPLRATFARQSVLSRTADVSLGKFIHVTRQADRADQGLSFSMSPARHELSDAQHLFARVGGECVTLRRGELRSPRREEHPQSWWS